MDNQMSKSATCQGIAHAAGSGDRVECQFATGLGRAGWQADCKSALRQKFVKCVWVGGCQPVLGAEAANFQVEILVVPWLWSL